MLTRAKLFFELRPVNNHSGDGSAPVFILAEKDWIQVMAKSKFYKLSKPKFWIFVTFHWPGTGTIKVLAKPNVKTFSKKLLSPSSGLAPVIQDLLFTNHKLSIHLV